MRTITGLFDSRPDAERAVEALVQQHGLDRDRIQVQAAGSANATAGTMEERKEEHHGYRTGDGSGAIMVSLLVPEDQAGMVQEALASHGGRTEGPDRGA